MPGPARGPGGSGSGVLVAPGGRIDGAQYPVEGGLDDIVAAADAAVALTVHIQLNVADCLGIRAVAQGMLTVFNQYKLLAVITLHGVHEGRDHAVATARKALAGASPDEFGL